MAKTKIGQVSIIPCGDFVLGTKYKRLSVVYKDGNGYIARKDNQDVDVTDTEYWFKLVSKGDKGDTYQVTEEDLQRIANQITEDANSGFNQNVTQKTNDFNTNATQKTTEFNTNSETKTADFENNATAKITDYNTNHTNKLEEYNDNATNKTTTFNNNATSKTNTFNQHVTEKTTAFDENATQKTNDFNTNADDKLTNYNENAKQKTQDINSAGQIKIDEINSNQTVQKVKDLDNRVTILEKRAGNKYTIRRKISDNSSSSWERLDDAVGLVANAMKATTEEVQNDFDDIYPWSEIKSCNIDKNGNVIAYYGEPGFSFDGSNGEVFTRIPQFYCKRYIKDDYEYITIADYPGLLSDEFIKIDEFYVGRYNLSMSDGVAHSMSGKVPKYNTNTSNFRNYAKALGNDYCLLDWRIFVLQMLYLVEYADYNSQVKLGQGIVAFSSAKSLIDESNTNRIIVSSVPAGLWIGKTICIGATDTWNCSVAADRDIVSIEDYSENGITGKAIYFDGSPVNIIVGNAIWGSAQKSGECDSLGMHSGCILNNSYHPVIYRGIENIFGHLWQHIDGINIKEYQTYICYDPTKYVSDKFEEPYQVIGYVNTQTTDQYIKKLGYDLENPLIALPIEVGGSSNTYATDNYWCNPGNRIASFGGDFYNAWGKSGFFAWYCSNPSSNSYWNCGARLIKYQ